VGPRAGQKLFTLQTLSASAMPELSSRAIIAVPRRPVGSRCTPASTLSRPASEARAAVPLREPPAGCGGSHGADRIRPGALHLKTPYRDGTTHIVLEPLDLMARLAALVPPPRMHLTRYHGVFAPHSKLRAAVTPAGRGKGSEAAEKRAPTSLPPRAMWR
jgi:hypothetical protein